MDKQIHIFATKDDLARLLGLMEPQLGVKYYHCASGMGRKVRVYDSLLEYKDLGIAKAKDHISGEYFLVMKHDARPVIRKMACFFPIPGYAMDQVSNPHSIIVRTGGLYKKKYLICGHIGTASDSKISSELYKAFATPVRSLFTKVRSYHVGGQAMQLLSSGMRLITMGIDEPTEYDLKP